MTRVYDIGYLFGRPTRGFALHPFWQGQKFIYVTYVFFYLAVGSEGRDHALGVRWRTILPLLYWRGSVQLGLSEQSTAWTGLA